MHRKAIPPGMCLLHFNSLQWFNVIHSNQTTKAKFIQHLTKHIHCNAQHFFYISKTLWFLTQMLPAHHWIRASALLFFLTPMALSSSSSVACRGNESSTSLLYPWAILSTFTINIVKDRVRQFERSLQFSILHADSWVYFYFVNAVLCLI